MQRSKCKWFYGHGHSMNEILTTNWAFYRNGSVKQHLQSFDESMIWVEPSSKEMHGKELWCISNIIFALVLRAKPISILHSTEKIMNIGVKTKWNNITVKLLWSIKKKARLIENRDLKIWSIVSNVNGQNGIPSQNKCMQREPKCKQNEWRSLFFNKIFESKMKCYGKCLIPQAKKMQSTIRLQKFHDWKK